MSQPFASGGQSFGTSASVNEYSGLMSFRADWFNLLAVQIVSKTALLTVITMLCIRVPGLLYQLVVNFYP